MRKHTGGPSLRALVAVVVVVIAAMVTAGIVGVALFKHPIETVTVDRTPPVVLPELRDLAEYHAASGTFEVLVDIEKDVKYVPSALAGERTFFVGIGSVDAYVDFSALDAAKIVTSADGKTASITLPPAELGRPSIDTMASHVAARNRGLLNRVSGAFSDSATSDQSLYVTATDKIATAAEASDLRKRAEDNTRTMLGELLRQLGFTTVTIQFDPIPS